MRKIMPTLPTGFTRRTMLKTGGAIAATAALSPIASLTHASSVPEGFTRTHGLSVFGDLELPADFKYLNYVNPNAPIAGKNIVTPSSSRFNQSGSTFDTLNGLIDKNEAPALIDSYLFTTLMGGNGNEADAVYGLLAETIDVAEDGNSWRFNLRDYATFADGTQITAEDVAFSYNLLLEKGYFLFKRILEKMESAKAIDDLTFELRFQPNTSQNDKLGMIGIPILSKAFYTEHDFTKADLTKPLASGTYTVGDFEPGKFIEYIRRDNLWEDEVPIAKGTANFKKVRVEFYRDTTVAFEAFKAGEYLIRSENSSQNWATKYDFPAVERNDVVKELLPDASPTGTQGIFFNLRRPVFQDIRVREALSLMFDFEWTNENLFYGQYKRTHSFFQNAPYMATGIASDLEKEILAPYLDQLPDNILEQPWQAEQTDGSGRLRKQLRKATKLLKAAGFELKDGIRTNAAGLKLEISHPYVGATTERYLLPYKENLEKIGVKLTLQRMDPAQYVRIRKIFDYDMITGGFGISLTPRKSSEQLWASSYADQENSYNLAGIKNPIMDAISEKIPEAKTREELHAIFMAIDRVWRVNHFWIPNWYIDVERVAYWDVFDRPDQTPKYGTGVSTWWWNEEKANKLNIKSD